MEWKDHDDDDYGVMAKVLKVVFCIVHALYIKYSKERSLFQRQEEGTERMHKYELI